MRKINDRVVRRILPIISAILVSSAGAVPSVDLDTLVITPNPVDVLEGASEVEIQVRVTGDPTIGGILFYDSTSAEGFQFPTADQADVPLNDSNRISGTAEDGVYQYTVAVPADTPAFTYSATVYAIDDENEISQPFVSEAITVTRDGSQEEGFAIVGLTAAETQFDTSRQGHMIDIVLETRHASETIRSAFFCLTDTEGHSKEFTFSKSDFQSALLDPGSVEPNRRYRFGLPLELLTAPGDYLLDVVLSIEADLSPPFRLESPVAITVTNSGFPLAIDGSENSGVTSENYSISIDKATLDASIPNAEVSGVLRFSGGTFGFNGGSVSFFGIGGGDDGGDSEFATPEKSADVASDPSETHGQDCTSTVVIVVPALPGFVDSFSIHLDPSDITSGDRKNGEIPFTVPATQFKENADYLVNAGFNGLTPTIFTMATPEGELPSIEVTGVSPQQTDPVQDSILVIGSEAFPAVVNVTDEEKDVLIYIDVEGDVPDPLPPLSISYSPDPGQNYIFDVSDVQIIENPSPDIMFPNSYRISAMITIPRYTTPAANFLSGFLGDRSSPFATSNFSVQLTIENSGDQDFEPPVLEQILLDETVVDITNKPAVINGTLNISDRLAGIDPETCEITVRLSMPGSDLVLFAEQPLGFTSAENLPFEFTIPAGSRPGVWYLSVTASDRFGNRMDRGVTSFLRDRTDSTLLPESSSNRLVVTDGETSAYEAWIANRSSDSDANRGIGEDLDSDGIANGVEALLGLDPICSRGQGGITFVSGRGIEAEPSRLKKLPDGSIVFDFVINRETINAGDGAPLSFSGIQSNSLAGDTVPVAATPLGDHRYRLDLGAPSAVNLSTFMQLEVR